MKRVEDNSYLEQRGRVWWCNRRVCSRFAKLVTRARIKQSLSTTSIEQARYKRERLDEAGDHDRASLMLAHGGGADASADSMGAADLRHRRAAARALAAAFEDRPRRRLLDRNLVTGSIAFRRDQLM